MATSLTARIDQIENDLRTKGYHKIREIGIGDGNYLAWWSGPTVLIVQEYSRNDGVEVYGPLDSTNSMDALLAAIPE